MRKSNKKETICWDCQNYSRCSWSRGKPVKGWTATPTEILNVRRGKEYITHSYFVEDCPHFKSDKKVFTPVKKIAEIIGKNERYTYRIIDLKGVGRLRELLKEKGYKLYVYKVEEKRHYYLEKI